MNKILRSISAALLIAATVVPAAAKSTVNLAGRESDGFNALNHVLQKPLGNDTFPSDQHFGNNIFLGFGGGISATGDEFSGSIRPGLQLEGQLGGWITPVHGIRLSANVGYLSVHQGVNRAWFGAIRGDYLINLSNLLRGYDPSRTFELVSAVGLEYRRIRRRGAGWGNAYGIEASLQARFNVSPSLYLFVEPRLAMMTGLHYDMPYDWRRMRADLSLNIGLGYRLLGGQLRKQGSIPFRQINEDNLYFGVGGGLMGIARSAANKSFFTDKNAIGSAFVGKMFSAASGIEAGLSFGRQKSRIAGKRNQYLAFGEVNYVLNLDNAFGGYRPDQVFNLYFNVGLNGALHNGKVYAGVGAGLTGLFNLTPNWGLFIRPQLRIFDRGFARSLGYAQSPVASLELGVRYTIGDFSRNFPQSYRTYADSKHWFITTALSYDRRLRGNYGHGASAMAGFGKQFTPISSWRISLDGNIFPRSPLYAGVTVHADYLASITTSMYGYDPDRLFDLQMLVGVFGGIGQYEGPIAGTYGVKAGLQANFRLNSALSLFIEPQFLAVNAPFRKHSRTWTPELRAYVGLKYLLGTPAKGSGTLAETAYGERPNFVSVAAGPSMFSQSTSTSNLNITGTLDFSVGRWFTMVSGARLTYSNDWIHRSARTNYVGSLHADYLLNLTSLMERRASRTFHIIGAVGAGLAFCPNAASSCGFMTYGGVQFRFNLPGNVDLHIEPGANFWSNRTIPNPTSRHHFVMTGRLAVGASYRF